MKHLLAVGLLLVLAGSMFYPGAVGSPWQAPVPKIGAPSPSSTALPPDPVSYSAMGDSITTGYDANGTLADLGEQPYYSYGIGWNRSVDSFESRLLALYGPGSVTSRLLAVPGDVASDMIGQALEAVANRSGFVSILIGGNDVCHSSGGVASPTPVWNFSASLNHSLRILRAGLGDNAIITLGDVVDVPILWTLFGANTVADEVWANVCPGLTTASGRATMNYFVKAYNHIEQSIAQAYNVTLWDIGNLSFTADMVNTLDYFHPSPLGHQVIAQAWWSILPYARGLPMLTHDPALPASVPAGSPLTVSVGGFDAVAMTATVTYKETGAFFWSTTDVSLISGSLDNGTFSGPLPYNATSLVGTLWLFVTITDTEGASVAWPSGAPAQLATVQVTSPGSSGGGSLVLGAVTLTPSSLTVKPAEGSTLIAKATTSNGTLLSSGVSYSWSLSPVDLGLLVPESDGSIALLVPGESLMNGTVEVTASSGEVSVSATAAVHVSVTNGSTGPSGPSGGSGGSGTLAGPPRPGSFATTAIVLVPAAILGAAVVVGVILRRHYLRAEGRSAPTTV